MQRLPLSTHPWAENRPKLVANEPKCKAAINAEAISTGREKMRILDGALQALRRKGYIEYRRGAWLSKDSLDL